MDIDSYKMDISLSPMDTYMQDSDITTGRSQEEDVNDGVLWKSSQTTNLALDTLFQEAQKAPRPAPRVSWSWGSSDASTSAGTSFPLSNSNVSGLSEMPSSSIAPLPARRRAGRTSHPPRAAQAVGMGLGGTDPLQFMVLLKGVSERADENAGMRGPSASSSATSRRRSSIKERTMSSKRLVSSSVAAGPSRLSSVTAASSKGKGKERAVSTPLPMTSSSGSTASPSVSNSSGDTSMTSPSVDGDISMRSPGDTSPTSFRDRDTSVTMTSPEPDDPVCTDKPRDLMPPPPVPHRLPALDVCAPRPNSAVPSSTSTKRSGKPKAPAQKPATSDPPAAVSRPTTANPPQPKPPNPTDHTRPVPNPNPKPPPIRCESGPPHTNYNAQSPPQPEPRLHPILQQQKSAATATPANVSVNGGATQPTRCPPPAPAVRAPANANANVHMRTNSTHAPPTTQSQPQMAGPPALGMRRTQTAPLVFQGREGGARGGGSTFRTPFLHPPGANGNVGGANTGSARAGVAVKPEMVVVKTEVGAVKLKREAEQPVIKAEPGVRAVVKTASRPVKMEERRDVVTPVPDKLPQDRKKQRGSSPSDGEFSFDGDTSYDLDELEAVLRGYD
ncbi:hypothetical protein C8J57DRAFT_1726108 [Mycena rebaudengoi]|nr:hypothetical protein C8J57DRAFT_1726108 [Mycena rebaudengoi]